MDAGCIQKILRKLKKILNVFTERLEYNNNMTNRVADRNYSLV